MKFYISDLHFGHKNAITFDNRPFSNVDEMDNSLIHLWNSKVQDEDEVYIIGDFAYHNTKPEEWYLEQLKGRKNLIIGNHDNRLLKNDTAMQYFERVDKMMHVMDGKNHICLCHFPIAEWNGYHHGSYHIYGHIHGSTNEAFRFMKTRERAYNAGCMINNYVPVNFDELERNNQFFKEREGEAKCIM